MINWMRKWLRGWKHRKLVLNVTQYDIDNAVPFKPDRCALALTAIRALGTLQIAASYAYITTPHGRYVVSIEALQYMMAFDLHRSVVPKKFVLMHEDWSLT